ncbi:MAG: ATP-binding cassette domain-containing protein [Bacteroidota bacterium]
MNVNAIVTLKNVSVLQGDKTVLQEVNLDIEKGEFAYLIGKTGSGKSSLLKTLYAALPLQDGIGHVAGFNLRKLNRKTIPLLRRKLGIVFQDFNLLSDRNVEENLLFVLKATGWKTPANRQKRMQQVLEDVGLVDCLHKMPHTLSGGEQQRLVIARALLNQPEILLADEPTGNLDPDTSDEILQLLRNVSKERNTAVLFATHDYRIIEQFPARILRCHKGKVLDEESWIIGKN